MINVVVKNLPSDQNQVAIIPDATIQELLVSLSLSDKKQIIGFLLNDVYSENFVDHLQDGDTVTFITKTSVLGRKILNATSAVWYAQYLQHKENTSTTIIAVNAQPDGFSLDFMMEPSLKADDLHNLTDVIIAKHETHDSWKILSCPSGLKTYPIVQKFIAKYPSKSASYILLINQEWCCYINTYVSTKWPVKYTSVRNLAGAYFNSDVSKFMMQRLHGFTNFNFSSHAAQQDQLKNQLQNDHRHLNKIYKLFSFHKLTGQGFPLWLPNGVIIKRAIQNYLYDLEQQYGFLHVETPIIGSRKLYQISGHLDHYEAEMFPSFKVENENLMLRPMACPHHILIYKNQPYSYRDLPIRLAETAKMARYEYSGALTGLERVRHMELTDAHLFVTPEQVKTEIKMCLELIELTLKTFHIKIDYYALSLHDSDDHEKYFADATLWNKMETIMETVLQEIGAKYITEKGEAAFYGPKLDIQVRNNLGHEITISTIQLDFYLPQRFNVHFVNKNNEEQNVIMIHRGLIGTFERFVATILEQNPKQLPLWLTPQQVVVIPVSANDIDYADKIVQQLRTFKIRIAVDHSDKRLNYKIRQANNNYIPYQIIVGPKEVLSNSVNVRCFRRTDLGFMSLKSFIDLLLKKIKEKT